MDGSCEQIVCLLKLVEPCPSHYIACVGFGDSVCKYFNCFTISQNHPFLLKLLFSRPKRERQEYPSRGTASTNVWKFNKMKILWKKHECSWIFQNIPSQKTLFKKKNQKLTWTVLQIILVSVQHAKLLQKFVSAFWRQRKKTHSERVVDSRSKGVKFSHMSLLHAVQKWCLFYFFSDCPFAQTRFLWCCI